MSDHPMHDMLVRLYDLPGDDGPGQRLTQAGYTVRRPLAAEKGIVCDWVRTHFGNGWASETDVAFSLQPIGCFIAVHHGGIVGFACHDAAYRNFFGPTGVLPGHRRQGLGRHLLLQCLHAMRHQGYAYAIIGGVGPTDFYRRAVGAVSIEGSDPGIYQGIMSDIPV
jgi:GNAT superfamily N-acetyltransferase